MAIKMKGLLKGLRYISHIFEAEEQEPELQIGFPTDVKHVAHIGWDGPTTNAPSWMSQYKTEGDSTGAANVDQQYVPRTRELRLSTKEKRTSTGSESPLESPSKRRSEKSRSSRRQMTAGSSVDSPRRSSSASSEKQSRSKKAPPTNDSPGRESDSTLSSKGTRRKKSKALSTTSSSKTSSKSKANSQRGDGLTPHDHRRGAQAEATAAC